MARQRKAELDRHSFRMGERSYGDVDHEALVVGTGRHAYVWVGPENGPGAIYTFSGKRTLRAFAKAILRATGGGK